jgi:hypothetical protein
MRHSAHLKGVERVSRGHEIVTLEYFLRRRLGEPGVELWRIHIEEEVAQLLVINLGEYAA